MHYIQFPDLTRGSLARRLGAAEKKATIDPVAVAEIEPAALRFRYS